jgi:hypothetical protein
VSFKKRSDGEPGVPARQDWQGARLSLKCCGKKL